MEKALDYENINIVSSLWLQETFKEMKLAEVGEFSPSTLRHLLDKKAQRLHSDIHDLSHGLNQKTKIVNKKRNIADLA